jgi:hypothetical protein
MAHTAGHAHSSAMQECIDICTSCHQTCLHMVRHCLEKGGKHAEPAHISLLLDCAQICATSADFMTRHSDQHTSTCRACADVCRACAASCNAMGDDEMMKQCADECTRCAESGATMAQMA